MTAWRRPRIPGTSRDTAPGDDGLYPADVELGEYGALLDTITRHERSVTMCFPITECYNLLNSGFQGKRRHAKHSKSWSQSIGACYGIGWQPSNCFTASITGRDVYGSKLTLCWALQPVNHTQDCLFDMGSTKTKRTCRWERQNHQKRSLVSGEQRPKSWSLSHKGMDRAWL